MTRTDEADLSPDQYDRLFQALADPGRRAMVGQLSRGPASVKELASVSGMALPSAVKHLRVLEDAGFVLSHKAGRVRTFRIEAEALDAIGRWVRDHRTALEAGFDRLAEAMTAIPETEDDR